MDIFSLKGKAALVTGATHGIGFEMARALAGAGAKIVFNDRNDDALERGREAYKEANVEAYGYLCDVTDEQSVTQMIAQIENDVGIKDFRSQPFQSHFYNIIMVES